jgi:hypothetical protein
VAALNVALIYLFLVIMGAENILVTITLSFLSISYLQLLLTFQLGWLTFSCFVGNAYILKITPLSLT